MSFIKHTCVAFAVLLLSLEARTQENNNWVFGFGGIGLNFSNDTATLFPNKAFTHGIAGTAAISDNKGKLILYFDGYRVFNKNHNIVKNGENFKGRPGGIDNSIFVKHPTDSNLYYLIFAACGGEFNSKLYSGGIYVYTLNIASNSGEGEMDTNYQVLFENRMVVSFAATWHADNEKIWIVCRLGPNQLYDYAIDTIATMLFDGYTLITKHIFTCKLVEDLYSFGERNGLKFSHNGKYLAEDFSSISYYHSHGKEDSAYTYVSLSDFNRGTGEIKNRRYLHYYAEIRRKKDGASVPGKEEHKYTQGCAFSPNDSFLYAIDYKNYGGDPELVQFPLYEKDPSSLSRRYKFTHGQPKTIGVGPDKKLYINYSDWDTATRYRIITLENPDHLLDAQQVNLTAYISPKLVYDCFFPLMLYKSRKAAFKYGRFTCDSKIVKNVSDSSFKTFIWHYNNFTETTTGHVDFIPNLSKSGKYYLKLKAVTAAGWVSWYADTIEYIKPLKANFSFDTSVGCKYVAFQFKNLSELDTLISGNSFSHWFFGDGSDTIIYLDSISQLSASLSHVYTKTGTYTVKLIFSNGFCTDTFEKINAVFIKDAPKPGILVSKINGCQPLTFSIQRQYSDSIVNIIYNPSDGTPELKPIVSNFNDVPINHTYITPGSYWLKQSITGLTGCITDDSTLIHVRRGFEPTDVVSLEYATVADDSVVELKWSATEASKIIEINKSQDKSSWKKIAELKQINSAFIDKLVSVKDTRYFYQITARDTCDNILLSNYGSSLLLKGSAFQNEYSIIEWLPYEKWEGNILLYEIEVLDASGQWRKIGSVNNINYQDFDFSAEPGIEKCYRVIAVEDGGAKARSISNSICIPYAPIIWIPNSFSPNGDGCNDTFTASGLGVKEIKISIYNRYGELIYSCNETNCVWDGYFQAAKAPEGVYIYQIAAKTNTDKKINYRGTITLIR